MRRVRLQRGSALVATMAAMSVTLTLGVGTYTMVDSEQTQSGGERRSDSAFNLAEAALNTQAFVLSRDWPGTAAGAYPASCTRATSGRGCPDPAKIIASFSNVDVDSTATWTTSVRDNGGSNPNFYDDAVVQSQPAWDTNADDRVWVRAQAVTQGKKRTIAALVKVDEIEENMPLNAFTGGHFSTNNNGNKTIVDTKGRPLTVRCRSATNPKCLGFRNGQVSPPGSVSEGYPGGNALGDDALDRVRTRAIAQGTYYASGCPSNPAGAVVFVEQGDCSYTTGTANSPTNPGIFVIMRGTLYTGGNFAYYGLLYMGNRQGSTGLVVTMRGTSLIQGAVAIDGDGGMEAGASKQNLIFDPAPFSNLRSYGSAGIVQNSWRDLTGV